MNDLRIAADIGRRGRVVRELHEVGEAPGLHIHARTLEALIDRKVVRRVASLNELGDFFVDEAVISPVEILGTNDVDHAVERGIVHHQSAENGLLGENALRGLSYGQSGIILNVFGHLWFGFSKKDAGQNYRRFRLRRLYRQSIFAETCNFYLCRGQKERLPAGSESFGEPFPAFSPQASRKLWS